jgi:two-component system, sensor histidine kinase
LERILRNYLSNAIRYTDRGGIKITCVSLAEQLRIEVADSGIGIPAAQHREIFDEFHQLGNPERDRAKGLGLGLAIVDRVARLLGHSIDVESAPGEGSRFSVTVPLGDSRRIASDGTPVTASAGEDLAGVRTIVVDDEIGVREGMRTLLEQWGCEVTLAGSEDEAVDAARQLAAAPDAVIVDYRLRDGRTGVQAVERLNREFARDIPALIVTGDTAPERLREAKASGYQLVHKPVQPAMLRALRKNARRRH